VKISLAFDVPCFGYIRTPVQDVLGETKEEAISTVYCISVWQLQVVTDRYKEENGRRSWFFSLAYNCLFAIVNCLNLRYVSTRQLEDFHALLPEDKPTVKGREYISILFEKVFFKICIDILLPPFLPQYGMRIISS
jgi:predicted transcriptional regulator